MSPVFSIGLFYPDDLPPLTEEIVIALIAVALLTHCPSAPQTVRGGQGGHGWCGADVWAARKANF